MRVKRLEGLKVGMFKGCAAERLNFRTCERANLPTAVRRSTMAPPARTCQASPRKMPAMSGPTRLFSTVRFPCGASNSRDSTPPDIEPIHQMTGKKYCQRQKRNAQAASPAKKKAAVIQ